MNICGIELKANNLHLIVLKKNGEIVETKLKKLELKDSSNSKEVQKIKKQIDELIEKENIKKVIIKKRMEKGMYAASTTSFKIEGLIQLNSKIEVIFLTAQKIASFVKKNDIKYPENLKTFQKVAYDIAFSYLKTK